MHQRSEGLRCNYIACHLHITNRCNYITCHLHITNGSQLHVGCTMHQRGQGTTISPFIASKGIEMTLSGPGSISSQRQKILSHSPVQLCQTTHASSRPTIYPCQYSHIYSIKYIFRNHFFGNMICKFMCMIYFNDHITACIELV